MQAPAGVIDDGLPIVQWDRSNQDNQQWRFEDADGTGRWYRIVNVGNGKVGLLNIKDPTQRLSHALIQNTHKVAGQSVAAEWKVESDSRERLLHAGVASERHTNQCPSRIDQQR